MLGCLQENAVTLPLKEYLREPPQPGIRLFWLGQAGFVLEASEKRIVIDPYLSDSLAKKYKATARPHTRMMPPPVSPDGILFVDLVACTHAHTDHMDPGTLPALLTQNPNAMLLVPRAMKEQALLRSEVKAERIALIEAGETYSIGPITIVATRAAHETLEQDAEGNHKFLGYVFNCGALRIWHSGDCIPYEGLEAEVATLKPNIALLPVNGRRPELSDNGVPGNFTLAEAIALTKHIGATDLVAHHYGLFDFNTEAPETIDAAAQSTVDLCIHRAHHEIALVSRALTY
ncbi:beta-lactamase superfamily domain protein [Ochrobactrum quorumnocens]|uniref:Beta-lactamase superfamily domain protein n=1 Tax=Ochrobactrum quorumnocens TaxID=271865 RepID=A0A248UC28_9HYPH|nr:MBL fold metallo-hydrolase [[Ochrobactrum] quorumnocens]ASV83899.1 beta-lactamase superfamily domain protein [[Ochrobactrum] quorumnocens]